MNPPTTAAPRLARVGGLLGLTVTALVLRAASGGTLAGPPPSLGGAAAWLDGRDAATASMALVRLLAEAATWYVLALSLLHLAAGALGAARGQRLAEALALPGTRRLVRTGLGLGLAAATSVGAQGAPNPERVTMVRVETPVTMDLVPTPAVQTRRDGVTSGTATMRPAPADSVSGTARMEPSVTPRPSTIWTVEAGESLWEIAESVLEERWGRPVTDAEIDPYWRALIAQNRGRLIDPDDPGLIHPGQRFALPTPPRPPG